MEQNNKRIRLAITHGDINGVGYEVCLKTFSDARMYEHCTPVFYGSSNVASYPLLYRHPFLLTNLH